MTLERGLPAPELHIEAAVSGLQVGRSNGRITVLVFHGPRTTDAPKVVGKAVRAAHPDASEVLVANVVDLRTMGGLWKKAANAQIKATYQKMASKIEGDASELVVICPDWTGEQTDAFGWQDTNQAPAVAVLGATGDVLAYAQGNPEELVACALGALA